MYFQNRGNKYNNKTTVYNGRKYMSRMEAVDAMWLDTLLKENKIKEVEPQHKIFLDMNGKHITTHIVDFLVTLNDGRQKFVETKGMANELWRIKMKMTEASYPDIPYLVNCKENDLLK